MSSKELAKHLGISEGTVRNYGATHGLRKSPEFLKKIRGKGAKAANKIKLSKPEPKLYLVMPDGEKIKAIRNKQAWFRSLKIGQTQIGAFEAPIDWRNIIVSLSHWNVCEGKEKGIRIKAIYDKEKGLVTITAKPYEEHAQKR